MENTLELFNTTDLSILQCISPEQKSKYQLSFYEYKKVKIDSFLDLTFAENIYKYIFVHKQWNLSSGIDNIKYEKKDSPENNKINQQQIKQVNVSFSKDQFSYLFYRSMNHINMSYFEFTLRKTLQSPSFIHLLREITQLELSKLTTLFLSKYKSGNYLAPHSDKGNGRLAFVIYLTKFWKPQYGGNLHFMNRERTEIIETYVPTFNQLILFEVPENIGIPHFVSHVAPNVPYVRYTITGWFD
jgi:Rps23 Pro-64 3,4-dihydroxylase Tpa1-like proline 4-hydroxylase